MSDPVGEELVQCEWCEKMVPLSKAKTETFPGATLTFCKECSNQ